MKLFQTTSPKHLYIHWPFCSSKCYYCDFVALEQHESFQDAYHDTLCKEIITFAQNLRKNTPESGNTIDTIFFGGGTPSLYPLDQLTKLFNVLHNNFNLKNSLEISLEANPADITEERLETWADLGINRISCGVQILDDDVLLRLNRRQRKKDVFNAMRILPKYFKNVSLDLILGLPDVTQTTWQDTIEQAINWPISHISIYFLTIHEKTPLYFKVQRGELTVPNDDIMICTYTDTVNFLAQHGFEQYEISNFSRPGHQSVHNKAYWDRKPYKGFGIGASSFDGSIRTINENNLERYLKCGQNIDCIIPCQSETLTPEQDLLELLMLGLRQKTGLDLQRVLYSLMDFQKNKLLDNLKLLQETSCIEEKDGRIFLTLKGMALENEVLLKLI